jgi:hypothetical protein
MPQLRGARESFRRASLGVIHVCIHKHRLVSRPYILLALTGPARPTLRAIRLSHR